MFISSLYNFSFLRTASRSWSGSWSSRITRCPVQPISTSCSSFVFHNTIVLQYDARHFAFGNSIYVIWIWQATKSTNICLQYELYSTICAFTFIILLALQFHIPFCLFMYCVCNYSIHNLFLCNAMLMDINSYLLPLSDSVRLWPCLWRSGAREHSSRTQTEAQKHMWVEEPWSLLDTVVITVFTSSSSLSSAVLLSFTMQHSMCNICVMQWILSQLLSYHAFTCFKWQHNINLHFNSNLLLQDSCFVENPVVALKGVLVKELHLVLLVDVCIACWS